jgi:hypothetical protein
MNDKLNLAAWTVTVHRFTTMSYAVDHDVITATHYDTALPSILKLTDYSEYNIQYSSHSI